METKVVYLNKLGFEDNLVRQKIFLEAGEMIRRGGVVAFPTETVYGLGVNALDAAAVKKIFEVKGRPQDNPLIVHVASFDIMPYVEYIPEIADRLIKKFWPGPLTILFKKTKLIPDVTTAGLDSVGIRMPSNEIALTFIRESGVPIAAPSANISGRPSPTDIERCIEDLDGKVDMIIGGGSSEVGVESTVIDCTMNPPCVLRPGGITLEMLHEVCSNIYIDPIIMKKPEGDFRPKAPGMKYKHYAPKAMVKIVEGDLQKTIAKINEIVQNYIEEGKKVGIMATDETAGSYKQGFIISLGTRKDLSSVARNLFRCLREFDDNEIDVVISEGFQDEGIGIAIMNRLRKSAAFDIIKV